MALKPRKRFKLSNNFQTMFRRWERRLNKVFMSIESPPRLVKRREEGTQPKDLSELLSGNYSKIDPVTNPHVDEPAGW